MSLLSVVIGVIALIIFFAFIAWLSRLYVKAPADRAFVRVGGPGAQPKVIVNGGALVFGLIHEVTWVDLSTIAIEVERKGENALLTSDPQYADIRAIFYIKVQPTKEGITTAARTIGSKEVGDVVKELVDAKLDGALRDVAATFRLMNLHQQREEFIERVQERLKEDLEENGLTLESVSIVTLRSAAQGSFPTDDVFGAQVARANAEVIEAAKRERNDTERKEELAITERDIDTEKKKLSMQQDLAFATATQLREVRSREAEEKEAADKSVYEQEQATEQARIAYQQATEQKRIAEEQATEEARLVKERALELATIEKEQAILVQEERKQQEQEAAEIKRQQAIEVAQQAKKIAVLAQEQKREAAERERFLVAAQREEAEQQLATVEETASAKREAQIQIIQAERDAQRSMIERKNQVEIAAMKEIREAEARAEALNSIAQAEFEAAKKQAETRRTQAQAESDSAKMLADAKRAQTSAAGLAEAEVIRAKAQAMQLEAEVIRAKGLAEAEAVRAKGLAEAEAEHAKAEALAAFNNVSQQLELEKLRMQAQIQIEVARAKAMGEAIANMQIKMFGTPEAADNILRLMSFAEGMNDIMAATPPAMQELGSRIIDRVLSEENGKEKEEVAT